MSGNTPFQNGSPGNGGGGDPLPDGIFTVNDIEFTHTAHEFIPARGLPSDQGWLHTGFGTIFNVQDAVRGRVQTVTKFNDNDSNIFSTEKALTAGDWLNMQLFGGTLNCIMRCDTNNGDNGSFVAFQVDAVDAPDGHTENRRYGLSLRRTPGADTFRIINSDGGNTYDIHDAIFNEYNHIVLEVPPFFALATLYVNGHVIATDIALNDTAPGGGTGTKIVYSSGSSAGTSRVTYVAKFGANIYTEDAVKTLTTNDFDGFSSVKVVIPPGPRDYTLQVAAGIAGRPVAASINVFAQNVLGSIRFVDLASPADTTLNDLSDVTIDITDVRTYDFDNVLDGGNQYNLQRRHDPALIMKSSTQLDALNTGQSAQIITSTGTAVEWLITNQVGVRDISLVSGSPSVIFGRMNQIFESDLLLTFRNGDNDDGFITILIEAADDAAFTQNVVEIENVVETMQSGSGQAEQHIRFTSFSTLDLITDAYVRIICTNSELGSGLTLLRARIRVNVLKEEV